MASTSKKMYAWTPILLAPKIDPDSKTHMKPIPKVNVGEEVNASKLGVSQEEFDLLISHGVVRSTPYPTSRKFESPKEAMRRKAIAELELAESGGYIDSPDDSNVAVTEMDDDN